MLRKIKKDQFEKYAEYTYRLAMDLSCSGFPVYTDGVKTRETFYDRSKKGLERDSEEILLYEEDGEVKGWIHYYFLEEDKYIGVCSILIETGYRHALEELFEYWKIKLHGFTWGLYFPEENVDAITYLRECGYQETEPEIVEVLLFENYTPKTESAGVISINRDNYEIFREIHSQYDEDMYWTSQRIAECLDDWEIFAYLDNNVCRGVIYHNGKGQENLEIFGIDCDVPSVAETLLISCLNKAKAENAKSMYFFTEEAYRDMAKKTGFRCVTVAHYFEGNA